LDGTEIRSYPVILRVLTRRNGAKAGSYVDCFMDVICWQNAESHFKTLSDSNPG
jgi:hypothetical protein